MIWYKYLLLFDRVYSEVFGRYFNPQTIVTSHTHTPKCNEPSATYELRQSLDLALLTK